jgi:hypothetical protein
MLFFKTFIDKTLADDKLKLLGLEGIGARHILMCYIAKSPIQNYLYRTGFEPYEDSEICGLLGIGLQQWLQLKKLLLKYGGFALNEQNALGIVKFAEHQSDYYRQRIYRKVTPKVTEVVTDRSKKLEVRSKKEHIARETTPLQKIVLAYKLKKGFQKDDKEWDKLNFGRCMKSAKVVICIDILGNRFNSKGLDWRIETIVKNASDYKLNKEKTNE